MKVYKYKIFGLIVLLAVSVQAQKFDKTIKEKFKVNSDVEVVINAAHTDVDIETWNKNEVSIEAVMEIKGLPKAAAEKILEKWKFEALGNKSKVKITSLSTNFDFDFKFDFDFDFPDIEVHEIDIPDLSSLSVLSSLSGLSGLSVLAELPEMPEMPEIDFEVEFDYDAYKKDSTYLKGYKMRVAKQLEKFNNSDWKKKLDSVRNSDEYKLKIIEFKEVSKEMAKEMKDFKKSKEYKRAIEESRRVADQVRKEMLENKELMRDQMKVAKEASRKAMEMIKKMKEEGKFDAMRKNGENIYFHYGDNKNSKVKIRKYFKVKVPKNATFDLNVRHGKLNVPKSNKKISANISYGNFIGGEIVGDGNILEISNSPVIINTIKSGSITLKNVPNATFGTFENSNLFVNSSDVTIENLGSNVTLSQKFGKLEVKAIMPKFSKLDLILDYAKAILPFEKLISNFEIDTKISKINIHEKSSDLLKNKFFNILNKYESSFKGSIFSSTKTSNRISLNANYSTLTIR